MDEIKLAITSPNNVDYKGIMLRKFFYMIFIDAYGKRLYAYIATVFGGLTEKIDKADEAYKSIKYKTDKPCALIFEVSSGSDIIETIHTYDITDSYFRQTEQIQNVWDKCEELKNQEEVNKALKELYPDLYDSTKQATIGVSNNTIIKITDKQNKPSHNCIVTKGCFERGDTSNKYIFNYTEAEWDGVDNDVKNYIEEFNKEHPERPITNGEILDLSFIGYLNFDFD